MRAKLVILRVTLEGSFGKLATIQLTGMKGELPRDQLPPLKLRGVRHDPDKWLKNFQDETKALGEAKSRVGTNTKKLDHLLVLKDEALEAFEMTSPSAILSANRGEHG